MTFRSDVLSALTGGPLQHGAFTLFWLAVLVAAILGLAVMLVAAACGEARKPVKKRGLSITGMC